MMGILYYWLNYYRVLYKSVKNNPSFKNDRDLYLIMFNKTKKMILEIKDITGAA